jgi:hypothetical protein
MRETTVESVAVRGPESSRYSIRANAAGAYVLYTRSV